MIQIIKGLKFLITGGWQVLKFIFTLPKFVIWIIVGVTFFVAQWIGKESKKDEIKKLDTELFKTKTNANKQFQKDSTIIAQKDTSINSLKTSLKLKDNLIGQYQVSEQRNKRTTDDLRKEIQLHKESLKKAIDAGSIICDTLVLERKQKLLSNKYYYIILDKPADLKELIRD